MKETGWKWMGGILAATLMVLAVGCDGFGGPDTEGDIVLSSQLFGSTSYYLFGYSYEDSEFYKFQYAGEPIPDIINEGSLGYEGTELISRPVFTTPGDANGFALVETYETTEDARDFYKGYDRVEEGLQFELQSSVVELHQIWVQKTSAGNYVKILVKEINFISAESGKPYNEVSLEYTYQPDGSTSFPK
jgi:hypothetical protein